MSITNYKRKITIKMSQQIHSNYLKWKDSVGVKVSLPSGWEQKNKLKSKKKKK